MNYRIGLSRAAFVAVLTITAGQPSWADDTEIFFGAPTLSMRPNVLFVIDTSGSMNDNVNVRPPYVPATAYAGTCASTAIYWKKKSSGTSSTPPSCASNDKYVNTAAFVCQSARTDLNTLGVRTIGPMSQWDAGDKKWEDISSSRHDAYVECETDAGIDHGLVTDDEKVPANGSRGPYTTNSRFAFDWNSDDSSTYFLYTGNYLNYYNGSAASAVKTRLTIVKEAAKKVIASSNLNNTNVGMMRFDTDADGGMVVYPFTAIESARSTSSSGIGTQIDALSPSGNTPLSETLYEAYLYLTGRPVDWGDNSSPVHSVAGSLNPSDSTKYKKIIDQSCEQTYVIYLTDGQPTSDVGSNANIVTVQGKACTDIPGGDANGKCLDDLAGYMHGKTRSTVDPSTIIDIPTDLYDDPALTGTDEQKETVTTYTIGFGDTVPAYAQALLEEAALVGGGENFSATDDATLTEAFSSIAADIEKIDITFTSPTVSVNAFNRTRTLDDLFFSVFQPAREYHWPGNLKKYTISSAGTLLDAHSPARPAINLATGFFKTDSRSYWSVDDDGEHVTEGGAASNLPVARTVYSNIASGTLDLTATANAVVDGNTAITSTMLGLGASATTERTNLISWIRGQNITNLSAAAPATVTARMEMGDPLHAQPASVIYGKDGSGNPIGVVYTATNDGYLHAINVTAGGTAGTELWSFIPRPLLGRMASLHGNAITAKTYGLDGSIAVYRFDKDGDGTIEPAAPDNDRVYLYFGMGRGGSDYYAIDVTNRTAPAMLWTNGASGTLTGLGQSWSTPVIAEISSKPTAAGTVTKRKVAILAGGYDATQDGGAATSAVQAEYHTDTVGNHIFMVDYLSGELLWRADGCGSCTAGTTVTTTPAVGSPYGVWSHPKMVNSIPSDIRVVDVNDDGLADRFYVGDMGARVWRFDIINGEIPKNLVRGGVFASLGFASGIGTNPTDARRFYHAPDASLLRVGSQTVMNLIIGSGFRGHPLNTYISDRIYSLRDPIPFRAMTQPEYDTMDGAPIVDNPSATPLQLVDATSTITPTIPSTAKGWKINLASGEKVLAEAQTFSGTVILPTYSPAGASAPGTFTCNGRTGTNRLYTFMALNGSPGSDLDANGTRDLSDRSTSLGQQGIAPAGVLLFPSSSAPIPPTVCDPMDPMCVVPTPPPTACPNGLTPPTVVAYIGAEKVPLNFSNCPVRTYWKQNNSD